MVFAREIFHPGIAHDGDNGRVRCGRERDVVTPEDIAGLFDESNRLIASRANLLVDAAATRRESRRAGNGGSKAVAGVSPAQRRPEPKDVPYLAPRESLPGDVLYRPMFDGSVQSVVVEVNLAHPFAKAVFSAPPGEGRNSVPRKATTAIQQLLYCLGAAEYGLAGDDDNEKIIEQMRRYASMNLRALLE